MYPQQRFYTTNNILLKFIVSTVSLNQIEAMLQRPNFAQKYEHWHKKDHERGIYSEIMMDKCGKTS